jgi:MoaA/NifB/PqqE/SkfB family radical SAM enzyme
MCDIWQRKEGGELDLGLFSRHRESLRKLGVRQVVLTGGEPLLHRNFQRLCAMLKECGVRITLLTSGLLLASRAGMIAAEVDEVIVSLDGPQPVHDGVRRIDGAFRLISDGVRAVKAENAMLPVRARCTVQKANHRALRQTVAAARSMMLDSISFLAADLTSQAFNRELVWPGERQDTIALGREGVASLDEEMETLIREHASDIQSRYIVESEAKLRGIVRRFREHLGDLPPIAPICNAPWVSAVLEVDGSVRPCFFHRRVGNVRETTLEQVINGDAARQFRAWLKEHENPTCQRCVCALNYQPEDAA